MTVATLDKDALKQKYAEERDKRLRADGNAQYQRLEGAFDDLAGVFVPDDRVVQRV